MAFILTLKPEVEQRLRELAEAENRSMHKTVEAAVEAYLNRQERDEWTRATARILTDDISSGTLDSVEEIALRLAPYLRVR